MRQGLHILAGWQTGMRLPASLSPRALIDALEFDQHVVDENLARSKGVSEHTDDIVAFSLSRGLIERKRCVDVSRSSHNGSRNPVDSLSHHHRHCKLDLRLVGARRRLAKGD